MGTGFPFISKYKCSRGCGNLYFGMVKIGQDTKGTSLQPVETEGASPPPAHENWAGGPGLLLVAIFLVLLFLRRR